jgi:hypothetical protein
MGAHDAAPGLAIRGTAISTVGTATSIARTRPRGFVDWQPRAESLAIIEAVQKVLQEYEQYLPLTIRQIFYRLVTRDVIDKTEKGYASLCEKLNRARRAQLVAFESIRDDGLVVQRGHDFDDLEDARDYLQRLAASARFDLQTGQDRRLVVWCEAQGMVPQLVKVAERYGVSVISSGGFDSVTAKHDMACKLGDDPHEVLHLGDFDPSGVHICSSLAEDLEAFADGLGLYAAEMTRLAVTPAQISALRLPTAPPKVTDRRSFEAAGTVQCEAIPPDELARILEHAITERIDMDVFQHAVALANEGRAALVKAVSK